MLFLWKWPKNASHILWTVAPFLALPKITIVDPGIYKWKYIYLFIYMLTWSIIYTYILVNIIFSYVYIYICFQYCLYRYAFSFRLGSLLAVVCPSTHRRNVGSQTDALAEFRDWHRPVFQHRRLITCMTGSPFSGGVNFRTASLVRAVYMGKVLKEKGVFSTDYDCLIHIIPWLRP